MKIKEYLYRQRMTQKEFAGLLGISNNYMNTLYHDRSKPTLDLAYEIHIQTEGLVTFTDWLTEDDIERHQNIQSRKRPDGYHKIAEKPIFAHSRN